MNIIQKIRSWFKKEEPETMPEVTDYYTAREQARIDIDTAMAAHAFLDEMDVDSPDIIRWNLKRKLRMAKKQCLEILCVSINDLAEVVEEDEEDEE